MNTTIKNFSKVLLVAISIFSVTVVSSCSKDGEPGAAGTNGTNGINGTNASVPNTGFNVEPSASFDQSIPNVTFTKVQFANEITDDMNAFNTTTSELTIPQNGFYHLSATVAFFLPSLPDNTPVIIQIKKNDVVFKSFGQRLSAVPSINVNGNFKLNAGDIIKVEIFHNSGSAKNLDRIADRTFFSGFRVY